MQSLHRLNPELCVKSPYGLLITKAENIIDCKYLPDLCFHIQLCLGDLRFARQFFQKSFVILNLNKENNPEMYHKSQWFCKNCKNRLNIIW